MDAAIRTRKQHMRQLSSSSAVAASHSIVTRQDSVNFLQ